MQQSPFQNSSADASNGDGPHSVVELRAPQKMKLLVPGAVALGGVLAFLVLTFLPSSTAIMKLAGSLVLLTDIGIAIFLIMMFSSRRVRADDKGLSVRGPGGEKSIVWSQVAAYKRVAAQSGNYISVCDMGGKELVKIESFLGTREQRQRLTALLDAHVTK